MFRPSANLAAHERAHRSLLAVFAASGLIVFSWLARIPSVRDDLALTPVALGTILLVGSLGALATVFSSPALVPRFGSTRMFAGGAVVMTIGMILMGIGPALASHWVFAFGIVVNGIGGSLLTVPMNVESTRIELAYGRSVIPHFHAAFSAGAVAGSLLGAASSWLGIPVVVQFAVVGVLVGALRLAALTAGLVMPGEPAEQVRPLAPGGSRPRSEFAAWTEPATLLSGVIAFAAALSEGAANNWASLSFVDAFGAPEAAGAVVLGIYIAMMTVVRVFGAGLIDRLGRVATLQLSVLASIVGLAFFGLSPTPVGAVLGAVLWGAGSALCFPIAVASVSGDPRRSPARVSVLASLASVAVLTAAPLVGVVAPALGGSRQALLVVLVLLVAALAASRRVGPSLAAIADPRAVLDAEPVPAPV